MMIETKQLLSILLILAFGAFAVWPGFPSLGALAVLALLFGFDLKLTKEKDDRIESLRIDIEKQVSQLRDKVDGLVLRGQR